MADRTQKPRVDEGPNQTLIFIFMGTHPRRGRAVISLWQIRGRLILRAQLWLFYPLPVGSGSPTQLRAWNSRFSNRQGDMFAIGRCG